MVLEISFLDLSNTIFQFSTEKFILRSYTVAETLSTINRIEIIDKKEFARVALDENSKTFVVYVAVLKVLTTISIHVSWAP